MLDLLSIVSIDRYMIYSYLYMQIHVFAFAWLNVI